MIKYGKVIEYNGSSGYIISDDGNKYILLAQNLVNDNIKENDYVSFKEERYKTVEIDELIATFVKKIKN